MTKKYAKTFFLSPTTVEKIEDVIKTSNLNKATGPNSIPVIIFREIKKEISEPLSILINLSFNTGDFPNCLNLLKVIPVIRKEINRNAITIGLISLLSNISKLIETLLYNRLWKFFNQSKCLFNYQVGFRNNHSTNLALISITEKIIEKHWMKENFPVGYS